MSEPPRKRPRSAMSPEERKEARAHRNRIAAQNSRDRRKAHFTHLERRVAELEEENRRLRAGLPVGPSSSCSAISEPDVVSIEHDREEKRKQAEEQRERENEQLRERIRSLEIGYQTVLRALADQGKSLPSMHTSTSPSSSPLPLTPSSPSSSRLSPTPAEDSSPSAASPRHSVSMSPHLTFPLSPAPTHSTLADSPLTLAPDSLDLPFTPAFSSLSSNSPLLDSPKHSFDLTLSSDAPTRHLARVATTPGSPAVALQRVGSARAQMRSQRPAKGTPVVRSRLAFYLALSVFFLTHIPQSDSDTASDDIIACLLSEIIASPACGVGALSSDSAATEETLSAETLSPSEHLSLEDGFGFGKSVVDNVDWMEPVQEMDRLLKLIPDMQDGLSCDVDMDFSNMVAWDGVSVS